MSTLCPGPACALCTAPALLYRNYWHGQLDNLDEMSSALQDGEGRFWTMRNGYTLSNPQQLDRLRHAIEGTADRELLLGQLKVGVHSDIAVTRKDAQGPVIPAGPTGAHGPSVRARALATTSSPLTARNARPRRPHRGEHAC